MINLATKIKKSLENRVGNRVFFHFFIHFYCLQLITLRVHLRTNHKERRTCRCRSFLRNYLIIFVFRSSLTKVVHLAMENLDLQAVIVVATEFGVAV